MQQEDQNRLAMWKTVSQYLKANDSVWSGNKPFSAAAKALDDAIAAAGSAIQGQTGTSTGLTDDKAALEAAAISAVTAIAKSAKAYALDNSDNTLMAAVNFSKSTLYHLPEAELSGRLRSIVSATQAKSTELADYGVNADAYTNATDAIAAFEQAAQAPRGVIAGISAVTAGVPAIMKDGRMALTKMDNLIHIFEAGNPQFSAGYKAARVVVHSGQRHNPGAQVAS